MSPPGTEALLAAAYACFLILAGLGLDLVARHSHNRSTRYRTAGFRYASDLDAWICSEGQHLQRVETDHERRLVRYRGKARVCNNCPVKADCTESDQGREIAQALDPWPHSEAGRFHRGISLALLGLAGLIVAVALVRNHAPSDLVLLGTLAVAVLVGAVRMLEAFRRTPSGFPGPGSATH